MKILSFALALSLIGCAVLAYLWIDRSVTLSYATQSLESSNSATRRLGYLLESEWRGLPEEEVHQKLVREAARHPEQKIVIKVSSEEHAIWFDEIRFDFMEGRLKSIQHD